MIELQPYSLDPEYYAMAQQIAKQEIDKLAPYRIDPPTKPDPGELIEMEWPEADVQDYRLGLEDGRTLAIQTAGLSDDRKVILEGGMPSCAIGTRRLNELMSLGIQLITYDRPGYGCSDRLLGRTVADCVGDIGAIAAALQLENYTVFGRSRGGASALACGANRDRLPGLEEVWAAATAAPPQASKEIRTRGVGVINTNARRETPAEALAKKQAVAAAIHEDPLFMVKRLAPDLRQGDYRFFKQCPDLVRMALSHYFSLTNARGEPCADGWFDDGQSIDGSASEDNTWGFKVQDVDGSKVTLWAGTDDGFCPHTQTEWLAEQIKPKTVYITPTSHFSAMDTTVMLSLFACDQRR
jgi:pimeloyl-ACP methyl ester carboxylesterase